MTEWITATPPTPNGDLHLGHLAGPYIAGDVLRRFLAADGREVLYTTGLDDHQTYVPVRGLKDGGRKGTEVADGYGESITRTWLDAEVHFGRVGRPRVDAGYAGFVQDFFRRLYDGGHIVAREMPLPYCVTCDRWLYEAYVSGGCPHCGGSSGGNACEPCGRPNYCGDLLDPHCVICGEPAEHRDCERLFFPLAPFAAHLKRFWGRVAMPPHLRALCERMLADGLPEIAVSHPGDWGVPVPVREFADHRIYVWFEMAPGYLLEFDPEGVAYPAAGPVQFFGFDNGYFHAVLNPAVFAAYDPAIPLPRAFVVNEFYRLDGLKFSTSRRHAIWAHEALAEAGSDLIRYHVSSDRPNGRQTSFSRADLDVTRRALGRWNDWLERLFLSVHQELGGVVPVDAARGVAWERLRDRLVRTVADLRDVYDVEGFDPRRAVALLDEVVASAADFGYVHEHERDRPGGAAGYRAALVAQLELAAGLAAWAAPILPRGSAKLADLLGIRPDRRVDTAALCGPPPGTVLAPVTGPVFGD
ncbi:MAG: class I tRNA ligase family protein [Labedaea sp.]